MQGVQGGLECRWGGANLSEPVSITTSRPVRVNGTESCMPMTILMDFIAMRIAEEQCFAGFTCSSFWFPTCHPS
jgi:hypothetical protein